MGIETQSFLMQRSMMPRAHEVYLAHVGQFRACLKGRPVRLEDMSETDVDLELGRYLNRLYFEGHIVAFARYAVYSQAWLLCIPTRSALILAHMKQALKGCQLLDPDRSRDPAPWEVCLLIAHFLGTRHGREGLLAACASLLAFDAYLRPGETLAVERRHVVRPKNRRYTHWAIIICPSTEANMSKHREPDDTITIGVDVMERSFVCNIVEALVDTCAADGEPLVQLSMPAYAKLVRGAAAALGLSALKFRRTHGDMEVPAWTPCRALALSRRFSAEAAGKRRTAWRATTTHP